MTDTPHHNVTTWERTHTTTGKAALVFVLLLFFSTDSQFRIVLGPLWVPPYILICPLIALFVPVKLFKIPNKILIPLGLYFFIFTVALLRDPNPFPEMIKVGAGIFTLLFFSKAVQTPKDYHWVGFALVCLGVFLGFKSIFLASSGTVSRLAGINPLDGIGNKNAQSLYTLPGLYYASTMLPTLFRKQQLGRATFYIGAIAVLIIGSILSANRSGWIAAALVILWGIGGFGISLRTVAVVALFSILTLAVVQQFGQDIIDYKVEQTVEGYSSDDKRQTLLTQSMLIGLENPFLGLGKEGLILELGTRVKSLTGRVDPHNVYGYLMGAGGFFVFVSFFTFLGNLVRRPPAPNTYQPYRDRYEKAYRYLLVGFVVLFLIRGFFTREIIYSPTFMGMLGALFGLASRSHAQGVQAWYSDHTQPSEPPLVTAQAS
ncbi:MAG: O-antigen ligase family protein [Bacteroidota bacterium]